MCIHSQAQTWLVAMTVRLCEHNSP